MTISNRVKKLESASRNVPTIEDEELRQLSLSGQTHEEALDELLAMEASERIAPMNLNYQEGNRP